MAMQTEKILIVDDQPYNIDLLIRIFRRSGYTNYLGLEDPTKLESTFRDYQPDIVLLDIHMPVIDGITALKMIRSWHADSDYLPVLILTADTTPEIKQTALSEGANDFLNKPFDRMEVLLRINNLLQTRSLHKALQRHNELLELKVRERTEQLEQAQGEVLQLLARVSEFRDDITGKHTQRVGILSGLIAQELGLPDDQVDILHKAATLHDIGKIGIPDEILLKKGSFSEIEFERMKQHTLLGEQILTHSQFEVLKMAEVISVAHHEKWNGNGYPRGLKQEEIPLAARIVAVSDFYDALTHQRPYKKAWSVEDTLAEIESQKGKHFDPKVADACIHVIRNQKYNEVQDN